MKEEDQAARMACATGIQPFSLWMRQDFDVMSRSSWFLSMSDIEMMQMLGKERVC